MSKYFTKWLPVKGEILPGDKFTHRLTDSKIHTNTDLTPIKHHPYYKKVKLILCSRDIQTGDEVQNGDGITCKIPNEADLRNAIKHQYFKVIGEISPAALSFVKEGMEFEEGDVRKAIDIELYYSDASEQYQYYKNYIKVDNTYVRRIGKGYNEEVLDENIEIKCPTCGHFH